MNDQFQLLIWQNVFALMIAVGSLATAMAAWFRSRTAELDAKRAHHKAVEEAGLARQASNTADRARDAARTNTESVNHLRNDVRELGRRVNGNGPHPPAGNGNGK